MKRNSAVVLGVALLLPAIADAGGVKYPPVERLQQNLSISVSVRSPDQIAAFYEGRGFPKRALDVLRRHCFVTVVILNKHTDIVWLETGKWRIQPEAGGPPLTPLGRDYWKKQWQKEGLSLAHQSTFGWTQLPDSRDLRPQEPVGGNLSLPVRPGRFSLEAAFATGPQGKGKPIHFVFRGLNCPP